MPQNKHDKETTQVVAAELDKQTVRSLIARWLKFGPNGVTLFRALLREYALLAASNAREILDQQRIIQSQEREISNLKVRLEMSEAEHGRDLLRWMDYYDKLKVQLGRLQALAKPPKPLPARDVPSRGTD